MIVRNWALEATFGISRPTETQAQVRAFVTVSHASALLQSETTLPVRSLHKDGGSAHKIPPRLGRTSACRMISNTWRSFGPFTVDCKAIGGDASGREFSKTPHQGRHAHFIDSLYDS